MCSALILLASFLVIQSGSTKFAEYCINDAQCNPGERCIPDITGLLFCQQALEQMPTTSTVYPAQIYSQDRSYVKMMHNVVYLANVYILAGLVLVSMDLLDGR
ncbi:hypothetical protein WUBG_17138, partial [Wuchereria bancrofti]